MPKLFFAAKWILIVLLVSGALLWVILSTLILYRRGFYHKHKLYFIVKTKDKRYLLSEVRIRCREKLYPKVLNLLWHVMLSNFEKFAKKYDRKDMLEKFLGGDVPKELTKRAPNSKLGD